MGDLEQIEPGQTGGDQPRVDAILDVTGQQEAVPPDRSQEHDRDVVDAGPTVRWFERGFTWDRPEHRHRDLVDRQAVAGDQAPPLRGVRACKPLEPGRIPGTRAARAGLEHLPNPIALKEPRQAGDVVFVRMRQDDRVDAAIPRRQPTIEGDQQPGRIRSTIHEQPAAVRTLDQDRVALTHVQHGDPRHPGRASRDDGSGHEDRDGKGEGRPARPTAGGPRCRRRCRRKSCRGWRRRRHDRDRWRHDGPGLPEPMMEADDESGRDDGRQHVEWRLEGDAGERQARACLYDRNRDAQQDPRRGGQDRSQRPRGPGHDEGTRDERDESGGHRGRQERDHDEVHGGRHE